MTVTSEAHRQLASLQMEAMKPAEALSRPDLLGVIGPRSAQLERSKLPEGLPVLGINTLCLAAPGDATCEVLFSAQTIRQGKVVAQGQQAEINYRQTDDFLFGVLEVDEALFHLDGERTPLLQAAESGYRAVFELLESLGYSNLIRAWNYLAEINRETHGLERYRQFNIGRQCAFVNKGRSITGNVPAACALGIASGPLQIAFLASRVPMRPIENPRQVSAYHYPSVYGPRSPTFSRAGLLYTDAHDELLFISGTASIVGHETLHHDDVVAQVGESLANISVLLDQANKVRHAHFPCGLDQVDFRIYIRHPADLDKVRSAFEKLVGTEATAVYVLADVCRSDLLVEIEGSAMLARGGH